MAVSGRKRAIVASLISLLVAIVVAVVCPFIGGFGMDYSKLWHQESPDWTIFLNLRVPRTLLALITGAALASSGAMFQALLRDALATPSNLGVTAAASLGAVIVIAFFSAGDSALPLIWMAAIAAAYRRRHQRHLLRRDHAAEQHGRHY